MELRVLAPPDMEPCLDLFEAVAAEGLWLATEPPVDRREVRARWNALLLTGEGTLLCAVDGGAHVGLSALVGRSAPELGMLVARGRRGQGVGGALLEASVAWAADHGARHVVLHVFPHNTAAIALYSRHGFEDRGLVRRAYPRRNGERWDAIRMVRRVGGELRAGG